MYMYGPQRTAAMAAGGRQNGNSYRFATMKAGRYE